MSAGSSSPRRHGVATGDRRRLTTRAACIVALILVAVVAFSVFQGKQVIRSGAGPASAAESPALARSLGGFAIVPNLDVSADMAGRARYRIATSLLSYTPTLRLTGRRRIHAFRRSSRGSKPRVVDAGHDDTCQARLPDQVHRRVS